MPFTFAQLNLPGLVLITPRAFTDDRGFFMETFKATDFERAGIRTAFVQDNHSLSHKGILRGLHFQRPPKRQAKLVRVVKGSVWDVAVDLRPASKTYRRWTAVELSASNNTMLFIPAGFAHGFLALEDDTHLLYKCSAEYDPALDAGVRWDDPAIAVEWPTSDPVVSSKDQDLPFLAETGELD
ncbi:MAG TPA: dTDP-4-dehydrorhamnose 3,5-epimerase [Spirochaetia bacterium]|nr:dTDP-4-dehydrorhamnose 3,5-epimerase [Spirochaetia bacterium]